MTIEVFTTRPDTLFGATYMVLAPEHPLVDVITANEWPGDDVVSDWSSAALDAWKGCSARRARPPTRWRATASSRPRSRSSSARRKGARRPACSPARSRSIPPTRQRIPIFIADYVLMGYGTGAIMAVPAHDERDFEFARVRAPDRARHPPERRVAGRARRPADDTSTWPEAYVGDGVAMNSANDDVSLDGLPVDDAKR